MRKESITQAELKELLDYDPETGIFRWKNPPKFSNFQSGVIAGCVSHHTKYVVIKLNKECYPAHRLAWLWVNGYMPDYQIDHINGDRSDNRIGNLRLALRNHFDNAKNQKKHARNKSGFAGVRFNRNAKKFVAYITTDRVRRHLGYFDTAEEAYTARLEAQKRLWSFQPEPRE